MKRAGLPGVSMDHAPDAGYHCRIPLCTTTTTAAADGAAAACGGTLKRGGLVAGQAHKRCIHWRGGGCWRWSCKWSWNLGRSKDWGVNRR